jgi:hypothetical protein
MKKHLQHWGAVYLLFLMFLGSWAGQLVTQLREVRADAQTHGEPFVWSDFWYQFWAATFENWQSEFFQLAFQAILVASFYQVYLFKADYSADKSDVQKILDAINDKKDAR